MRKRKGVFRSRNYLLKMTDEEFHYLFIKAKLKLKRTVAFYIRKKVFPFNWKKEFDQLKKEFGGKSDG